MPFAMLAIATDWYHIKYDLTLVQSKKKLESHFKGLILIRFSFCKIEDCTSISHLTKIRLKAIPNSLLQIHLLNVRMCVYHKNLHLYAISHFPFNSLSHKFLSIFILTNF